MSVRWKFDTKSYLAAQSVQVMGELNKYYTGLAVGHDPTPEECWRHWCASKAAETFRWTQQSSFWVVEITPGEAEETTNGFLSSTCLALSVVTD